MRTLLLTLFTMAIGVLFASPAFAADTASAGLGGYTAIATAFGMAIAAFGCALAQGMGLKGACEGTARNPEASGKIMVTLILGLAFIESIAIYALVVNLILLVANPFIG